MWDARACHLQLTWEEIVAVYRLTLGQPALSTRDSRGKADDPIRIQAQSLPNSGRVNYRCRRRYGP
jgi:hypothetical protein